jgi:hypothetical protein
MPDVPPFPLKVVLGAAWAMLHGGKRSLHKDALACTRRMQIKVSGAENVPTAGPGVVVTNHYYRPGFSGVWIGLMISAVVPEELAWVMSAAWTEGNTLWSRFQAAVSVPLFPRLAQVYNLIAMPPMPPRPHETAARARAVRHILAAARRSPAPLLAIAPEGQDSPGGLLRRPPSGVGRMLYKLAQSGCRFYPVGIYEQGEQVVTNFGQGFLLGLPEGLSQHEIDRQTADRVMSAIAGLLPHRLRGAYAGETIAQRSPDYSMPIQ